jgi:hypothetical protein
MLSDMSKFSTLGIYRVKVIQCESMAEESELSDTGVVFPSSPYRSERLRDQSVACPVSDVGRNNLQHKAHLSLQFVGSIYNRMQLTSAERSP